MRVWDQMDPTDLCDKHLLAQWREALGLWSILINEKKGYANHPETKRWVGCIPELRTLLTRTRDAMLARGWRPKDIPGPASFETTRPGGERPPPPWDDQLAVLRAKGCACKVPEPDDAPEEDA